MSAAYLAVLYTLAFNYKFFRAKKYKGRKYHNSQTGKRKVDYRGSGCTSLIVSHMCIYDSDPGRPLDALQNGYCLQLLAHLYFYRDNIIRDPLQPDYEVEIQYQWHMLYKHTSCNVIQICLNYHFYDI